MTAPAKRDNSSPCDSERISRGIFDYDVIAHHAIRAVVIAYDCSFVLIAHYYPREKIQINRVTIVSQAAISKKHCSRVLLPKRSRLLDQQNLLPWQIVLELDLDLLPIDA